MNLGFSKEETAHAPCETRQAADDVSCNTEAGAARSAQGAAALQADAAAQSRDALSRLERDGKAGGGRTRVGVSAAAQGGSPAKAPHAEPGASSMPGPAPDAACSAGSCPDDAAAATAAPPGRRSSHTNDQLREEDQQQQPGRLTSRLAHMRISLPESTAAVGAAAADGANGPPWEPLSSSTSSGTNDSDPSPSQQRPRGWQAMLCGSPQDTAPAGPAGSDTLAAAAAAAAASSFGAGSSSLLQRCMPPLSAASADSTEAPIASASAEAGDTSGRAPMPLEAGASAAAGAAAPAAAPASSRPGRPAPLMVPVDPGSEDHHHSHSEPGPPSAEQHQQQHLLPLLQPPPPSPRLGATDQQAAPRDAAASASAPAPGETGASSLQPAAAAGGAGVRRAMRVQIPTSAPLSPFGGAGSSAHYPLPATPGSARPYSGPTLFADELDLDAIDGVAACDPLGLGLGPASAGSSASSSPISAALAARAAAAGGAAGGAALRSSRDQDLRRVALMASLTSPRPPPGVAAQPDASPAAMFTGSNRARGLAYQQQQQQQQGLEGGGPDAAASPAAAASGQASTSSSIATDGDAQQLLQALRQSTRGLSLSVLSSPASSTGAGGGVAGFPGASGFPLPGHLQQHGVSRSLPGTPGRAAGTAGSGGSSLVGSPLVPAPSHGAAAALLSGSVLASPRTPRSPLNMLVSPRSSGPRSACSLASSALPAPLFNAPGGFVSAGAGGGGSIDSPNGAVAAAAAAAGGSSAAPCGGNNGIPPAGRHLVHSSSGSGRTSSHRFYAASPSQTGTATAAGPAAAPDGGVLQLEPLDAQQQQQLQQEQLGRQLDTSLPLQPPSRQQQQQQQQQPNQPHHGAPPPSPYQQMLRHNLQVADTRRGPHGESPLSPSHHSSGSGLHLTARGEALLSPTRPAPLVQPSLTAAPSDAGAGSAAAQQQQQLQQHEDEQPHWLSVSAAGAAAAAAAGSANHDDNAAANGLVGGAGRGGLHDWLDRHSWHNNNSHFYELPRNLRAVADLPRLSTGSPADNADVAARLSASSIPGGSGAATPRAWSVAAAVAAGNRAGSGSSRSSSSTDPGSLLGPRGVASPLGAAAVFHAAVAAGAGPGLQQAATGSSSSSHAAALGFGSNSSSRLVAPRPAAAGSSDDNADAADCSRGAAGHRSPGSASICLIANSSSSAQQHRTSLLAGAAAAPAAAGEPHQAAAAIAALLPPPSSIAAGDEPMAAAAAARGSGGSSGSRPSLEAVLRLLQPPQSRAAAGAAAGGGSTLHDSSQPAAASSHSSSARDPASVQQQQHHHHHLGGGGSSSSRLLSPGHHLYTAGVRLSQDSCCCSCPSLSAGQDTSTAGSTTASASSTPAAIASPASPDRAIRPSSHGRQQQQQHHQEQDQQQQDHGASAAAAASNQSSSGDEPEPPLAGCLPDVSKGLHALLQKGADALPLQQDGQQAADKPAPAVLSQQLCLTQPEPEDATAVGGFAALLSEAAGRQPSAAAPRNPQRPGVPGAAAGPAALGQRQHWLLQLLSDGPALRELLASLPGVDPSSWEVTEALAELRLWLQAWQQQQQHEEHDAWPQAH